MNPNFFNPHNLGGDYLDLENDLRLGTPTAGTAARCMCATAP